MPYPPYGTVPGVPGSRTMEYVPGRDGGPNDFMPIPNATPEDLDSVIIQLMGGAESRSDLINAALAAWAMRNPEAATTPESLFGYRDQLQVLGDDEIRSMLSAPTQKGPAGSTQDPNKLIALAKGEIGKRYAGPIIGEADAARWGDPGWDCSSFVSGMYKQLGIKLTPFTDAAASETQKIDPSQAQPGDIIFYKYSDPSQGGVTYPHMALYLGPGRMLDASYGGGVAERAMLDKPYEIHRAPGVEAMRYPTGDQQAAFGGFTGTPSPGVGQGPVSGAGQFSPYDDVFARYTPPELRNDNVFKAILAMASKAESGWDPTKSRVTDKEDSHGLFQMNRKGGAGAGYSVEQLQDPDLQARIMVPQFARAYQQLQAQQGVPVTNPQQMGHFAALVAGMVERPAGTTPQGILGAGTPAYNNYIAAWTDITRGGTPANPPAQQGSLGLPTLAPGDLSSPEAIKGAIGKTYQSAMEQIQALSGGTDKNGNPLPPDPEQVKNILDGAKLQGDLLQWWQTHSDTVGAQQAQNELGWAGLSLQRDLGLGKMQQDLRLELAKLAQGDQQFNAQYGLALRKFQELELPQLADAQRKTGADITGIDPATGLPTEFARQFQEGLGLKTGELLGTYQGQPTVAARSLEEQISQHRDALRAGFSDMLTTQGTAAQTAQTAASALAQRQAENAPMTDPTGQYVQGQEPGGFVSGLRGMLGMPFSPLSVSQLPQAPDPRAGLAALQAAFEQARQGYPTLPPQRQY